MNARMVSAALAASALATFAGSGQSEGIGRPLLLRPATLSTPLLGVRDGSLVRLDPRTLKPTGRGLLLAEYSRLWSFSPDRRQLVFVRSDGAQAAGPVRRRLDATAAPRPRPWAQRQIGSGRLGRPRAL